MFALGIRYLMGWAMAAADGARKEGAEWPPHPDRVFMALAAAWFETGEDPQEGEVLQWLELLQPPGIWASPKEDRVPTTSYVPVNDTSVATSKTVSILCSTTEASLGKLKEAGLALLPEFRSRQPRGFPVAIPHHPVVYLVWPDDLPVAHRQALETLSRKVTSIGHSASLVQMWLTDEPPRPNLVPKNGISQHRLRVFGPGRLNYLRERCNRVAVICYLELEEQIKRAKGRDKKALQNLQNERFPGGSPVSLRPEPGLWQGYNVPVSAPAVSVQGSLFDPRLVILKIAGRRLSLPVTLKLTEALRGALFAACPDPIPEWLSGHTADGAPSKNPHLGLIPLPFAGADHADGRLMGIALVLPKNLDPAEVDRILTPWLWNVETGEARRNRLFDGQWLECTVELETSETPPTNLKLETWTASSRRWATVTPVVLDRHFDGAKKWELAAESVKVGCERIGLPRPGDVLLHPVSMIQGVPRANEFPRLTRKKDGGRMHHAHAIITFDEVVQGPIMVGAGRFRGYGFCRPLTQGGGDHG
ncbi:type I-G CRISPR-associated protein Csb2 [Geoalkalibacter halelectricus]|uniref:Type I-U CRISPR-associated protein Csb2 n=1 Tax=Geoalkalibacter halelectricus TaxID=2847045 RepID=A0ABY5ZRX6_9BACT|nr:type I-U CRISPR-associated protein Csb2 [Geoalkalibacter halelectricus]MDO3377550.1 type I-U CRISPR-associated protein Csb2 [Geoalkalibacter halelectricus]UWZ80692.1 type I-U CRISPR-associated protein Csb2 [Geoalkalibacter halelectricus]